MEAVTDPDVPPMPLSYVRPEQAQSLNSVIEGEGPGPRETDPEALGRKIEKFLPKT